MKNIPTYTHWNLSHDNEHYHHVVVERLDPYAKIQDCPIVQDFGVIDRSERETSNKHVRQAQQMARELNQKSFDDHIKGQQFTRYQTNWYVCIDQADAERSANIDHTPLDKIRVTENVEILHTTGAFTLWSDGKITKNVYHLPYGGSLTSDAAHIIETVRGSDTGHVEGGIITLTRIKRIGETRKLSEGESRGLYAAEKVEEWDVEWLDGTPGKLYIHTAGYFEGYQFDVYTSLKALSEATAAPGPEGISDFESGFTYDPELGYVKDQQ